MKTVHFLNLTNGLEWLPALVDCRFIRLQSTACEQKRWGPLLLDLDHDLLCNLAMGRRCVVHDASPSGHPRALWQGLALVRYVCERVWFEREVVPPVMRPYFREVYRDLPDTVLNKFKYYRKFLMTDQILLEGEEGHTRHDGDYAYFRDLLEEQCKTEDTSVPRCTVLAVG